MKEKLALVIAALMMTSIAFSISTTSVSATHTQGEPSIDESTVKAGTSMVRTITVRNEGPDPIDNVRIILPSGWTPAPTLKVPGDNTVELADPDNEGVVLLAGTRVVIPTSTAVTLPENTELIRLAGDNIFVENVAGSATENRVLVDNVRIKKDAIVNAENLVSGENLTLVEQRTVALLDNEVVTLAETIVVRVTGNIMKLPENTMVKVKDNVLVTGLTTGDNLTTENEKTGLILDNGSNWVTQEVATTRVGVDEYEMTAGSWIRLWINAEDPDENRVVLSAGSKVSLSADTTVELYENTEVRRVAPGATENIYLTDIASAENQPVNWDQSTDTSTLPPGEYAEWTGIGDNQIGSGEYLAFPIAFTTSPAGGNYTIYVKTTDNNGETKQKEITLTVDNVSPTVQTVASPTWVKDNVAVTITITASESLAKLENVMVAENNAPENTQIENITPNVDNTIWTCTYTTGDNNERDGTATIYVIGLQFEDLVGNAGTDNTGTFTVDRMKPPTPDLGTITGFPTDAPTTTLPGIQTNQSTWLIENVAQDNLQGSYATQENMTVKIRVGTTTYELTTPASGYYDQSITLTEGTQEVGIQYIDRAGNEGDENVENVTYDGTAPSISITSPAAGAYINDNTPTITLTITDDVIGVENEDFNVVDNSGYIVYLRANDNTNIDQLDEKVYPTESQFKSYTFENDYPIELVENWYNIFVQAGDNLQKDNAYFRFYIDTSVPTWTATEAKLIDVLDPVTMDDIDKVTNKSTMLISGTAKEANSTITIYADDTVKGTYTTGTDKTFSITIEFTTDGIYPLYIQEIDQAGNASTKQLMGTWTVDLTKPVITLTAPEDKTSTDKSAITVSGTVTDTIATYDKLIVTIDCTGAAVEKTVYLDSDGTFSTTVPLSEAGNVINVVAFDGAGNRQIVSVTVSRTVTPWATYAVIIVIVALILAAIAIFRKR